MQSNKPLIIIGGGYSVKQGIEQGLWDQAKGHEIWACNSVYKAMPYNPAKLVWVDREFYNHEVDNLERLHKQGVKLATKKIIRIAALQGKIDQYESTRVPAEYYGKSALQKGIIYYAMGLCGSFALSLAIAQGYNEIYLLGYDCGAPTIQDVNTHWYQDRISQLNILSSGAGRPEVYLHKEKGAEGRLREELEGFKVYTNEPDVKIYNVSKVSHLTYFPKITYAEFFQLLKGSNV